MEILERVWEILGAIINAVLGRFERLITSIFGSANARYLKRLQPRVDAINALEAKYEAMSDEQLREQTELFRQRLAAGETLDDLLGRGVRRLPRGGQAVPARCGTTTCSCSAA